jgi:hypothetical protein
MSFVWRNVETRGATGFVEATARAARRDWTGYGAASPAADLRALASGCVLLSHMLGTGDSVASITRNGADGPELHVTADAPVSTIPARAEHQAALDATYVVLALAIGVPDTELAILRANLATLRPRIASFETRTARETTTRSARANSWPRPQNTSGSSSST